MYSRKKARKNQIRNKDYLVNLNDYEVVGNINKGGYGNIKLVRNKKSGEEFAAKSNIIHNDLQNKRFILREIRILMQIQHLTIIEFRGFSFIDFEGHKNPTILMNYMRNGSLADLIKKESQSLCPENYDNTKRQIILIGIARGMMLLHLQCVIHRDLKPENILLDSNFHPRITDFGMSKFFDPKNSLYQSIADTGTVVYMAPEVIESDQFNTKADVYSFGILMYEVIGGKRAYYDLLHQKNPLTLFQLKNKIIDGFRPPFDFPIKKGLQQLIEKCWSTNPDKRPTFEEIFKKLNPIKEDDYLSFEEEEEEEEKEEEDEKEEEEEEKMKYCLDDVDREELLYYVDQIKKYSCSWMEQKENENNLHFIDEIKKIFPGDTDKEILSHVLKDAEFSNEIRNLYKSKDDSFIKSQIEKNAIKSQEEDTEIETTIDNKNENDKNDDDSNLNLHNCGSSSFTNDSVILDNKDFVFSSSTHSLERNDEENHAFEHEFINPSSECYDMSEHSIHFERLVSPIYLEVVKKLKIVHNGKRSKTDLIIYDGSLEIEKYQYINPSIYINKIPGLNDICKNSFFYQRIIEHYPDESFYPKTFLHPKQTKFLKSFGKESDTFIFKPDKCYACRGIVLLQSHAAIIKFLSETNYKKGILQIYVKPKLIEKHKFGVRIFLFIAKIDPLILYIYNEGIATFCMKEYVELIPENLGKLCSHLAGSAINSKFVNEDDFEFIRKFSEVIKQITKNSYQKDVLWTVIKDLVKKSITALKDDLLITAKEACTQNDSNFVTVDDGLHPIDYKERFCHLIGIDIIIDSDLNPKVLGIHSNPGIRSFNDTDAEIKESLITDEFRLIFQIIKDKKIPQRVGGWEILTNFS